VEVEEADGTPSAASALARFDSEYDPSRASTIAYIFGVVVVGYGLLLAGATSLQWLSLQPPGSTLGPPSIIQAFTLRIAEGIYLGIFGVVLVVGGSVLLRKERSGRDEGQSPRAQRWRSLFPYAAVMLIVIAAVISFVPSPERTQWFAASDFKLRTVPGVGPYATFFMSRSFSASEGEAFYPGISITWTDNSTGAVVGREGMTTAWVTAPSALPSYTGFSVGSGNLAPADGSYVLWVRYNLCESPATPPCSNYTASARGNLVIATQKAYVPVQLVTGSAGSALIAVALVQSGLGSRRTTSR
jgi:hypothetical protein